MPTTRSNEPIASFEDGDTVTGFALLTKKERRQDKNGRDYLDLEMVDASGRIAAKVWSDSRALSGDYASHDFVAFKGLVHDYRSQLQLNVKDCRRATAADRQHGFDEAALIPSTREDINDLYTRLQTTLDENIERPLLERLVEETLEVHGAALREHPAAKAIHHAYRGGLLEHMVSMLELAVPVCDHYPELDRELVLIGILFHDLGKIRELGAMPANDYTPEGRLVGHIVIGRDLLLERCQAIEDFPADLQLHLEHLILSHQGRLEFSSPVEPKTPEAFVLHFIDDLDSKLAQLRQARDLGEDPQWVHGLGRFVYTRLNGGLEENGEQPEDSVDDSASDQAQLEL
jgi:3'-5' exoribonuclease